jgi:hypothetical protein
MFGAIKDRWVRATELADAAKATGQRWITPELGVGEFLGGFIGAPLAKSDANDPEFKENLETQIKYDVKPENRHVFDRDFNQIKEAQAPSQEEVAQIQAQADAQARADWLHKTRNSPAARSGAFTDDQRWATQQKHRQWQKDNNRGAYRVKDDPNTPNNEAKEAARAQRFKRRNERLIEKGLRPVNPR